MKEAEGVVAYDGRTVSPEIARLCNGVTRRIGPVSANGPGITPAAAELAGQTDPMEEARAENPLAPAPDDG